MKDAIIKGTGNSRYLKGAGWPTTYEEFKAMAEAGTLPIDLNGINAAGWQQIGDALSKANLLNDATAALLELDASSATVNNALKTLVLPAGTYALRVTVYTPGGRPLSSVTVAGINSRTGGACITDSNGTVLGYTTNKTPSISATTTDYYDFASSTVSKSLTLAANTINTTALSFTRKSSAQATFATSTSVIFSPDVDKINMSGIGAGGSGTSGAAGSYSCNGGYGGASGKVTNVANVANPNAAISITIGAAPSGATSIGSYLNAAGGTSGGGAAGGYSSNGTYTNAANGAVVSPNFLYPPTGVGGAGGGGGAYHSIDGNGVSVNAGTGGSPYGGTGGGTSTDSVGNGLNATGYGGGGGGGGALYNKYYSDYTYNATGVGGTGGNGLAGMTWTYK